MNLEQLRREIDSVDAQLVILLEKRMDLVNQIAAYKKREQIDVLNRKRETSILEMVSTNIQNADYEKTILETFESIMTHSRLYQYQRLANDKD
ncbi:chorismate mutase [Streptococcus pseudoporcinus]|uniref:Chorismate mutase n=2 Tax=Streptococcus pseudoporcinus TaxID=361101 RepID=G5K6M5_9STRE|nr:chorismate mutase [Streptococcus pseudoporcinus]EFR44173.1 chorismate mutase [Streptococcus pseudoporcinus SPIN 20026]EHI65883.1 chorismate mutase [Streptococcus pseudoporcinus LQ 940-04]VEF94578.1 chorismate mutase [Streptococcus pseudoporcinus]VTS19163.1 chorismate mutase [Streptococcus pseudoporcinus]